MSLPSFKKKRNYNLDPDEVFLDSSNIPNYDVNQFEGRIEKPLGRKAFLILGIFLQLFLSLLLLERQI